MNKNKKILLGVLLIPTAVSAAVFNAIIQPENEDTYLYTDFETYKNFTEWIDDGAQYDCTDWTPNPATIDHGFIFEQKQNCKQDQKRNKDLYLVLTNGEELYKQTETEERTIIEENKQDATGIKNYITGTSNGSWGTWSDVGGHYSCGSYSPAPSTVNYGATFTQTRSCKQNQTRTRTVYDDWADGTKTTNSTESQSQTINENETRNSTGTKNYVSSTSSSNGSWTNSGSIHSCSSWSPSPSTVASGQSFTQTRSCKQNQVQTVTTYNHWADGSTTVKSTTQNSKTIDQNQSRSATGTKVVYGTWVHINSSGTKYGCTGGSGYSGQCSPIGARVKAWVPNGQSSGTPICTEKTYECR